MMEEKLIQLLFPKFYSRYLAYKEQHNTINNNFVRNYEEVFNEIKRDNVVVLGIEKNGLEYVIVTRQYIDNVLYIKLYSPTYIYRHPKIMTKVFDSESEKFTKIIDIDMIDNDIGNGSICMEYFLEEARNTFVKYIIGDLSFVDIDHFDRLEHFYSKHGFLVEFRPNKSSGDITLKL